MKVVVPLALVAGLSLAACQNEAVDGKVVAADPLAHCDSLAPHAEVTACKERLAANSRKEVERLASEYQSAAILLDKAYAKAFPLRKDHADPNSFAAMAANSQGDWQSYANWQCTFEGDSKFGGSGGDDLAASCWYKQNIQRADELRQAIKLAAGELRPK